MLTDEEIINEYKKYYPGRNVSVGDIDNAKKYGLDIVKRSYEKTTGQLSTPAQAGQENPPLTPIQQKQQETETSLENLTSTKNIFTSGLANIMKYKADARLQLGKERQGLKKELISFDPNSLEFQGLSPEAKLQAIGNSINDIRGKISDIDTQKSNLEVERQNYADTVKSIIEGQIESAGLKLADLGLQREEELNLQQLNYTKQQDLLNFAFSQEMLLGGQMPEGLPENYKVAWEAASRELKRQRAFEEGTTTASTNLAEKEFGLQQQQLRADSGYANYLDNYKGITGYGSSKWTYGLDVDLQKGDSVYTPVEGEVIFAGENGGFGNQIQIKQSDGTTVWLSHLDGIDVKVGDMVSANQQVGMGGNTGDVIATNGGDGSHLDITMLNPDGSYKSATDVKTYLDENTIQATSEGLKKFLSEGGKRTPSGDGGFNFADETGKGLTVEQASAYYGVPIEDLIVGSNSVVDQVRMNKKEGMSYEEALELYNNQSNKDYYLDKSVIDQIYKEESQKEVEEGVVNPFK